MRTEGNHMKMSPLPNPSVPEQELKILVWGFLAVDTWGFRRLTLTGPTSVYHVPLPAWALNLWIPWHFQGKSRIIFISVVFGLYLSHLHGEHIWCWWSLGSVCIGQREEVHLQWLLELERTSISEVILEVSVLVGPVLVLWTNFYSSKILQVNILISSLQ